jgi:hypothetical protein
MVEQRKPAWQGVYDPTGMLEQWLKDIPMPTFGYDPAVYRRAVAQTAAGMPGAREALAIESVRGTAQEEVLQPIAGGVMAARDLLARAIPEAVSPAGGLASLITAGADRQAAPPASLAPADLREYGLRQAATNGMLGSAAFDIATDPATLLPIGRVQRAMRAGAEALAARGAAGQAAGQALGAVAQAGKLYDEAAVQMLRGAGAGVRAVAQRTPLLDDLIALSARGRVAQQAGKVTRALYEALDFGEGERRNLTQLMTGAEYPLPPNSSAWAQTGQRWDEIQAAVNALPTARQQEFGAAVYEDAILQRDAVGAEMADQLRLNREALDANEITRQEHDITRADIYQSAVRATFGLQQGVLDTLADAARMAFPTGQRGVEAVLRERTASALQRIKDEALGTRDLTGMLRGTPRNEPGGLPGQMIFNPADAAEFDVLARGEDWLYRQGRATMGELIGGLRREMADALGAPDEAVAAQLEELAASYAQRVGAPGRYDRNWLARTGAISPESYKTLEEQRTALTGAYQRTMQRQARIKNNATPILTAYYRRDGTATVDEVAARVNAAFGSKTALLNALDEAKAAGFGEGRHEALAAINADFKAVAGLGDIFKADDIARIAMEDWTRRYARYEGVTSPPPWLGWYHLGMGVWRDTALLTPRFHEGNLLWGMWALSRHGLDPTGAFGQFTRNLGDIMRQMESADPTLTGQQHQRLDALVGRLPDNARNLLKSVLTRREYRPTYNASGDEMLRGLGLTDEADNLIPPPEIAEQIGALDLAGAIDEPGLPGVRNTAGAIGRIPTAAWSAGTGAAAAALGYEQAEGSPEEKLRAALGAGAVGAAAGGALPTIAWASKMIGKAIEGALRTETFVQGLRKAAPAARDEMIDAVERGVDPVSIQTIGKPVTVGSDLFGARRVRRMGDLMAAFPGRAGRYTPEPPSAAERQAARTAWLSTDEAREAAEAAAPDFQATPDEVLRSRSAIEGDLLDPAGDVRVMPASEIVADPARFQFKSDVDVATGAGRALGDIASWEPESAGVILVWRDPNDHKTYVVNGHHRLANAKRLGVENLLVRYIDAPTAEVARARGALANLRDTRAAPMDAAKVMRQYGWGRAELAEQGVSLREGLTRQALALRDLDEGLFQRVATGRMDEARAVAIGQATREPAEQRALADLLDEADTAGRAVTPALVQTLVRQVRAAGTVSESVEGAEGLANTGLFDLFGGSRQTRSLVFDKAQATEALRAELQDEARRYATLAQKRTVERAGAVAGQTLKPTENAALAQQAEALLGQFDRALDNPLATETQAILDRAAQALASRRGRTKKLTATELKALRQELAAALETDAPALSSRNAWEAATARAGRAAGEVSAADLLGAPQPVVAAEAPPVERVTERVAEAPTPAETLPGMPEREAEFRREFPLAQVAIDLDDARTRLAVAEQALSDARLAAMEARAARDAGQAVDLDAAIARMNEAWDARDAILREQSAAYRGLTGAAAAPTPVAAPAPAPAAGRRTMTLTSGRVLTLPPSSEWLLDDIQRNVELVDRGGMVEEIERLAADGLTAGEIANRMAGRIPQTATLRAPAIVRSVRAALGIPSREVGEEAEAFARWQAEYRARSAAPVPTPGPTEPVARTTPAPDTVVGDAEAALPTGPAAEAEPPLTLPAAGAGQPPGPPSPPRADIEPPYEPARDVYPTGPMAPLLRVGMPEASPVLRREITPEQYGRLAEWMRRKEWFSPVALREAAMHPAVGGMDDRTAQELAVAWAGKLRGAQQSALATNNAINYDYSDVSELTEKLRRTGVFPFITWAAKTAPRVLQWFVQDPRYLLAIQALNEASEQDIAEAGLSPKFARLARMGGLGDALAETVLGRPDATLLGQPWFMVNPYAEVGRPARAPADAGVVERALDFAGQFGAGLGPTATLAARLTGQVSDPGFGVFRTSPLLEQATYAATGTPVDIEAPVKRLTRGVRGLFGVEEGEPLTGSPTKDYYVRQRIAELALERTGRPPAGVYLAAMDDPTSAIWREALASVNRQMAGQTVLAATVPFRTRALTEGEERVAEARRAAGLAPSQVAGVPTEERAARWRAAEANPATAAAAAFSDLAGEGRGAIARQLQEWGEIRRQTQRLPTAERTRRRNEFLEQRPALREYLAEHPVF